MSRLAPKKKAARKRRERPARVHRKHRSHDRDATEVALMEAALRVLQRDGVLAGVKLRDVAVEAGANRGLLTHYFGDRRTLLRAALEMRKGNAAAATRRLEIEGPRLHAASVLHQVLEDRSYFQVVALLALDGVVDFDPIPDRENAFSVLERQQRTGAWKRDTDLVAMVVAWNSVLCGYSLMREAFADQLELSVDQLDARLERTLGRMFQALLGDRKPASSGDERKTAVPVDESRVR